MSDVNAQFTSILLSNIRAEAKEKRIGIPKNLTCWREHSKSGNCYTEVYADGHRGFVWSGSAYNCAEAKFNYILTLFPKDV